MVASYGVSVAQCTLLHACLLLHLLSGSASQLPPLLLNTQYVYIGWRMPSAELIIQYFTLQMRCISAQMSPTDGLGGVAGGKWRTECFPSLRWSTMWGDMLTHTACGDKCPKWTFADFSGLQGLGWFSGGRKRKRVNKELALKLQTSIQKGFTWKLALEF